MLDDAAKPYLWPDDELTRYLNNAVREAAIRARLLHDDADSRPVICRIQIDPAAGGRVRFHESILAIRSGSLEGAAHKLHAMASYDMDKREPGWDVGRDEHGTPHYIVMDLAQKTLLLWPRPDAPAVLRLRVWRIPHGTELMKCDGDTPALILPDPEELRHWAAHEAYLKKDPEAFNPNASNTHLAIFEQRFGARPSLHEMARWADAPPRVRHIRTW